MFQSSPLLKTKSMVSYGLHEVEHLKKMESELMNHYSYNFSQLHKNLVREKYYQVKTIL